LAEGLRSQGRFAEALEALDDAPANLQEGAEALEAPEFLRVRATVLLSMPQPDESEAENCLMRSLACAHRQSALPWELRAAMTSARMWAGQGRVTEARRVFLPVYARFTEGFDSGDLQDAKQLLIELDK